MGKTRIIMIILILCSFIVSFYAYPLLPDQIASHWNAAGVADAYSSKDFTLFLIPVLNLVILGVVLIIPRIDPLKRNLQKFIKYYKMFFIAFFVFMLYIQILTVAQNMGYAFNMTYAIIPGMSILFYFIGFILNKTERNWFIGIRTPWTLSSDRVWKKTHELASKTFKAGAFLTLLTLLLGEKGVMVAVGILLVAALIPVFYSYFEYRKEKGSY